MAYFHCLIGGGSSGGGYELTVTCDAAFEGTTITCTDGVTTLTQTCPSASPYEVTFDIPNGGEWTVSGVIGGATYTASIDIPDSLELHSIPEGSTVLPTDDIQTWLACAGITDKSYTTLNEVLADSTTLLALISDNNASDYLVRSTTWASGITADSTAMTDIGANNYCANTLLSDSTWLNAICDSTYFESVLNAKVPTMTSDTQPSGEVTASSQLSDQYAKWKAFSAYAISTGWISANTTTGWIAYEFTSGVSVNKVSIRNIKFNSGVQNWIVNFTVEASTDGTWTNPVVLGSFTNTDTTTDNEQIYIVSNSTRYTKYRINVASVGGVNNRIDIGRIQFYGREDV